MNSAPTTWAWVRRITEIAPTVLWALAAAGAAIMIMYFPRILEARATIERQRAQEITEENRAYCEKWGLKAGTHALFYLVSIFVGSLQTIVNVLTYVFWTFAYCVS